MVSLRVNVDHRLNNQPTARRTVTFERIEKNNLAVMGTTDIEVKTIK